MSDKGRGEKSPTIGDLMIPIGLCARVREDATIHAAIEAQQNGLGGVNPRALLVLDQDDRVVGKIDSLDLILGVEEGYRRIGDLKSVSHMGFTREFIQSMIENNRLWQDPLQDLCRRAAAKRIGDIMSRPTPDELVDEGSALAEAIHRLALGHFPFLLVTRGGRVTGMLRTEDLFVKIWEEIRQCDS